MGDGANDGSAVAFLFLLWATWECTGEMYLGQIFEVLTGSFIQMSRGEALIFLTILAIVGIWSLIRCVYIVLDVITTVAWVIHQNRHNILHHISVGIYELNRRINGLDNPRKPDGKDEL
jgi:hypothetical protein